MSKQSRTRKLLEQGLQYHRSGDLASAEKNYIAAADADPRNADALNLRGAVALSTGRHTLAVTLFRKATSLQPAHPGMWGNLGNALFETGDPAESVAAYRRAAKLDPANPDFSVGIANALAASGTTDEAQALFLSVVERRPAYAPAWFGLAKLAEREGHADQALALYQRTLQANPNHGNAHLNTGVILQSQNRMPEAEQCYRRAIACGGQRDTAFINLTSVLTAQGNFAEAIQCASAGIAEFPRNADLYRLLAAAYMQMGQLTSARAPALQAAALDPGNLNLQLTLANLLFETESAEQGLAALKKIRDAHPDDPKIAYLTGITLLTAGDFDNGWRHFTQREVRLTKIQIRPWLRAHLPADLYNHGIRLLREQGLGDELFFLRFVPLLKALGASVSSVTNPKLESMLSRTGCFDHIMVEPAGDTPESQPLLPDPTGKSVDMLVGDLPHALYRDYAELCRTLPAPLALTALPEQIESLRERLIRLGPPPYLALTWRAGTAPHEQKSKWWVLHKQIGLDDIGKTLAGLPYTLLAVQRKPLPGEIATLEKTLGAPLHDLCDVNDDLETMLALLALVDEYVGVSNTNMHLRAGLARTARVLVTRPVEWRWMAYGDKSPWFPDFYVYRQGIDGSWLDALDSLRAHLLNALPGGNG